MTHYYDVLLSHSMCGLHALLSSPCQTLALLCAADERATEKPADWLRNTPIVCLLASDATRGAPSLRQAGIVSDRKLSKEWSCIISVTSQSSAQPYPAAHALTAIYKIPHWPSYGRGGCRSSSLLSASCSGVHIVEVPRHYVTALLARLHFNTILLADDNAEASQLSNDTKADCILASALH